MGALVWRYTLQLNQNREDDRMLIEYLERQTNKAGCIRRALKRQIEEESEHNDG